MVKVHLYRLFTCPIVRSGLASLVLRPTHLQPLTAFHRKTLRSFLSLSQRSPIPAMYFLLSELPIEARIHRDMFSLFYSVWINPETKVHQLVRYLLENMESNSRTWSIHLSNIAEMYGITSPLVLIKQAPPSKESFSEYVMTKITAFHEAELRSLADNNSKIKYFNVTATGLRGRHHPILDGPTTTHQVRKLRPVIKLLTGDFFTFEIRYNQTKIGSPHCRICSDPTISDQDKPIENVEHVVTACPATSGVRTPILSKIIDLLPLSKTNINANKLLNSHSIMTQFLLDPTSLNLENDVRIHIDDPLSRDIMTLSRDLCYAIHTERLKILKKINEDQNLSKQVCSN